MEIFIGWCFDFVKMIGFRLLSMLSGSISKKTLPETRIALALKKINEDEFPFGMAFLRRLHAVKCFDISIQQ